MYGTQYQVTDLAFLARILLTQKCINHMSWTTDLFYLHMPSSLLNNTILSASGLRGSGYWFCFVLFFFCWENGRWLELLSWIISSRPILFLEVLLLGKTAQMSAYQGTTQNPFTLEKRRTPRWIILFAYLHGADSLPNAALLLKALLLMKLYFFTSDEIYSLKWLFLKL